MQKTDMNQIVGTCHILFVCIDSLRYDVAYEEQENIYDMENVRENMGTYLTKEQYPKLKGNQSFIEKAAFLLRTYLDKNNMTYEYVIAEAIKELEKKFHGEGRVLIRPSGTEPLIRVMIEGKNQQEIEQEAEKLAGLITEIML